MILTFRVFFFPVSEDVILKIRLSTEMPVMMTIKTHI